MSDTPNERNAWADVVAELRQENAILRSELTLRSEDERNDNAGGAVAVTLAIFCVAFFLAGIVCGVLFHDAVRALIAWIG